MDWIEVISQAIKAIPNSIRPVLILPLHIIPVFRKVNQVIEVKRELARLEGSGNYDEARQVRSEALQAVEPSFSAPLWRSQGFDLLRRSRPAEALVAFQQGISHLDDHASMYGVSRPHELYYGAAFAALQAGEPEKASEYYRAAVNMIAGMEPHLGVTRGWWNDSLETLRRQLGEPSRS